MPTDCANVDVKMTDGHQILGLKKISGMEILRCHQYLTVIESYETGRDHIEWGLANFFSKI